MADSDSPKRATSAVPSGRFSRFVQLSTTAGRMALGGATEKIGRLARRAGEELPHALLTVDNARLLAERLARLRGAAMKVGQMLSLEGDNMLPPEFAKALEVLRSSAHRMPESQVLEVLEREYGRDWKSRFGSFDLEPLAAASIGQVHPAVGLDGRKLALKIQYPGVAESIDSDVDNLRSLLSLTRLVPSGIDLDDITAEVKAELRREVDYARELTQLTAYRGAVLAHLSDATPSIRIPEGHPELSTPRILALELVPGIPLLDWAKTATQEKRDAVGRLLFELLLKELFVFHLVQTDPNPGNYFYDPEADQLVLLDFGATREVSDETSAVYRKTFRGLALADRDLLREALADLGVDAKQSPHAAELLIDLALEASESVDGRVFDFRASNLSERLNTRGRELEKYRKELSPPPPRYLFFQRKLGGTFLLLRQLGVRLNCRQVLIEAGVIES